MGFIETVTIYKIIGAFVWAVFFNNVLLSRLISLLVGFNYVWQFEALSLLLLPIVMYSFIKTLKYIPTPVSLLHLSEFISLLFFIIVYFSFLFLIASAVIAHPFSIFVSTLICIITLYNQKHAFYFTFTRQTRFQRFCHCLCSQTFYRIINSWICFILFLIFEIVLFLFTGFDIIFTTLYLIICSDVIFSITTVVASEPVSFSSLDNKRLINGLNSKNYYERYLSFQDLYAISGGNKLRRNFLFVDPSGRVFSSIVESCSKLISSFCHRQEKMIQMGNFKVPIHRVNDSQWRRSQIYRQNAIQFEEIPKKPTFFQKIKNFFFGSKRNNQPNDSNRNQRLIRELDALELSPLILLSIQSLVRFLFILPKEDKYGVGQIFAEKILDMLLTTKSAVDKAANYAFVSPSFGKGWFASSQMDLLLKTKETVDWGVNEILRHFPSQLDYSRLSHKNIDLAQRLLGRKILLK